MAETGFIKDPDLNSFLITAQGFHNGNNESDFRPYLVATLLIETGMRISEVLGEHYDYYTSNGHKVTPKPKAEEAKANDYIHIKNSIGGLHIQDIDWGEKTLFIRDAKGNKSRYIPISKEAMAVVSEYLDQTGRDKSSKGKLIDNMTPKWLRKLFVRISRQAGVPDVYPHLFRNTFSVRYLKRRGDIRVLQKILGHSSLTVTAKYLKYTDRQVFEDYDRVMNQGGD